MDARATHDRSCSSAFIRTDVLSQERPGRDMFCGKSASDRQAVEMHFWLGMTDPRALEAFLSAWSATGGSELANTQSFVNELCALIGVEPPNGSRSDDSQNDYVFERSVYEDNGDGTYDFGRIDCYKRGSFVLEAKQGTDGDRRAAVSGEADLDLFGQTAATRVKRGTAKRGTPGWAKAMTQAKRQSERYAKALPIDHGWPPFLLVTDVGYCIEVYADFSGTGKAYTQFPDRARYRVMLEDLRDPAVLSRLAAIWDARLSLDPSAETTRVTREIGDLIAVLARRLEKRGHSPDRTSAFLMRLLFTMFAEDSGLLPKSSFTIMLQRQRERPELLKNQLETLWEKMDRSGFVGSLGQAGENVRQFNGYLFKETEALDLDAEELDALIKAAGYEWTQVEPAIFGTLLERALDPKERAKLGAHYTPRASVERLVLPTIIEPLRAEWLGVQTAAVELLERGLREEAQDEVERFHSKLARTRVLDPACGKSAAPHSLDATMPSHFGERVVTGGRALSPNLGNRMAAADISKKPVFVRELLPEDMKLDIDQFTRKEAVGAARYLSGVIGKAHGRQMNSDDRRIWLKELNGRHPPDLAAPTWLWSTVAALLIKHEEAYLAHCRTYLSARNRAA